ncbi:MAG: hypothetical protein ACM3SV_00155 [Betaproteobacteria bacterium]
MRLAKGSHRKQLAKCIAGHEKGRAKMEWRVYTMPTTPKKTAPRNPAQPSSPREAKRRAQQALNPRLKPDIRWQRSKRYGWDGR